MAVVLFCGKFFRKDSETFTDGLDEIEIRLRFSRRSVGQWLTAEKTSRPWDYTADQIRKNFLYEFE